MQLRDLVRRAGKLYYTQDDAEYWILSGEALEEELCEKMATKERDD